ncbi:MAG: hypothetical protein KAW92_05435 [Candidatus Cloacimonetes bacterium]|nr:hypothetical protein [Candidatus Cloacimonadota bacterium]
MSIRSEVFIWFEKHPEEAEKKGFGSNAELQKAFPDKKSKLLSKYKIQFNEIKRKEYIRPKPEPEIETIPPKESLKISINLIDILKKEIKKKKGIFLFCGLCLLLLILLFIKCKFSKKSHKK